SATLAEHFMRNLRRENLNASIRVRRFVRHTQPQALQSKPRQTSDNGQSTPVPRVELGQNTRIAQPFRTWGTRSFARRVRTCISNTACGELYPREISLCPPISLRILGGSVTRF